MDLLSNLATNSAADCRPTSSPFCKLRQHFALLHRILGPKQTGRRIYRATMIASLSKALHLLARDARAAGLTTCCSLVLHVLEQLAPAKRTSYLSTTLHALIHEWVTLSCSFLLDPLNSARATEMIEHMGSRRWERPVCRFQRESLLESLRAETVQLAAPRTGCRPR